MNKISKIVIYSRLCCLILTMALFFSGTQAAQKIPLNISDGQLKDIKYKIKHFDWAKNHWLEVKLLADETINNHDPITLPLRGGNWSHYYVDPEEGKPLVPGKYLGNWHWEHHNQAGTKTYFGVDSILTKDYDGVLILEKVHDVWASKLCALALAYRVDGNSEYLKKAVEVLEAYAKIYTKIPFHNKAGGNDFDYGTGVGRISAQALDESVWLTKLLQGLALIWNDIPAIKQQEIADNFLLPAADMIQHVHNLGVQNISNWYNAAVGMTGYLLGNERLIQWALRENGRGLAYQLQKGFTIEGNWYENAPAYHFYALKPIILLVETARNNGDNTFLSSVKKALDGPLQLMMPDMSLPRFNDSREVFLPSFAGYYDYGYTRFKDRAYLPVLNRAVQISGNKTVRPILDENLDVFDMALLYKNPLPAESQSVSIKSLHLENTGIDILYSGSGKNAIWLASKYDVDAQKGWHVHPDALNFVLYAKGEQISVDPGCAEYGAPVHQGWYRTTLAHNALVVNQKSQLFKKDRSISFGTSKDVSYSFCAADSAYQGVTHTRAYLIADSTTVLIADWICADSASTIDIAYHQRGTWAAKEQAKPWKMPDISGYKYLKEAEKTAPNAEHYFSTKINGREISILTLSSKPVSMISAIGNGPDFEPTSCLIARFKGTYLFMLWAIRFNNKPGDIRFELQNKSEKSAVNVFLGTKKIRIDPNGYCSVD